MIVKRIKNRLYKLLNPVNPNKWFEYPNPKAVYGGKEALDKYNMSLQARNARYKYYPSEKAYEYCKELEKSGFVIIKNFLADEKIDIIQRIVEEKFDSGNNLLNTKETQTTLRPKEAFVAIEQPFVNVPEIIEVAMDPLIVDITSAYLGCYSALGTCNLRKSFVNNLPDTTTQIFHVDPNSPRFLKCFIYFNNVTMEGGPFCFIKGSHKVKFQGWNTKYRWSTEEIHSYYGEEKVSFLLANRGDLIIADTNGFHRGVKPINTERTMLTLDYTCHIEGFEEKNKFLFPKDVYEKMDGSKKPLMDFVELI